jgi:hypothetical protein
MWLEHATGFEIGVPLGRGHGRMERWGLVQSDEIDMLGFQMLHSCGHKRPSDNSAPEYFNNTQIAWALCDPRP